MRAMVVVLVLLVLATPLVLSQDPGGPKPKRRPDVISAEEINQVVSEGVGTAYDVVQRLRPNFLRGRGATSVMSKTVPVPQVVVDGVPRGALETLRQIPAMTIREIRHLRASDATTQFGTGFEGGAIVVFTRSQ